MIQVLQKPLVHVTWIPKAIKNWFAIMYFTNNILHLFKFSSSFIQNKNLLYTDPWTLCPIHEIYGDCSHWLRNLFL